MRGGMRYGAGRPRTKAKTSGLHSIDIRRLFREDLLRPGLSYGWQWTDERGRRTSSITISTQERSVAVAYAIGGVPVAQRITLRTTLCNYGGERAWFECPFCRRRVAVLYLSSQVACRECFGLAYPSQSDSTIDRLWRRQGKIEVRMESGKWMTHATRQRLADELARIAEARNLALMETTSRLLGWQPFPNCITRLRKP